MDNDDAEHDRPRRIALIDDDRQHRIGQNNGGDIENNVRQTAPHFIGKPAQQRNGDKPENGADHQRIGRDGLIEQQRLDQITREEGLDEPRVARLAETQAGRQPEGFAFHHGTQ